MKKGASGRPFSWLAAGASIALRPSCAANFRTERNPRRRVEQSLGWYAGVGTGFDIDRHWSIGANFDYYEMSKNELDIGSRVFTVGAEYRF